MTLNTKNQIKSNLIEVSVPRRESERSCSCVRSACIYDVRFEFFNCSDSVVFLFIFYIFIFIIVNNYGITSIDREQVQQNTNVLNRNVESVEAWPLTATGKV